MIVYHAGIEKMEFPEIRITRYTKDFSWGFYCTNQYEQAVRWANKNREHATVNYYDYSVSKDLNILVFEKMTDAWLDFIAKCRKGELHPYDIVEGPMADDTVWNYVNDFLNQDISREAFWELAKFKYPTHQISFHTVRALKCLQFERSDLINDAITKG